MFNRRIWPDLDSLRGSKAVAVETHEYDVRLTPGGIGPSQALDVIALSAYAEPEVVTAFSLASLAASAIVSGSLAIIGLLSARRWSKIGERRHARHKPPTG